MDLNPVEAAERASDEELVAILERAEDWTEERRAAARAELGRRGIPLPVESGPERDASWAHWLALALVIGGLAIGVAWLGWGPRATGSLALPALAIAGVAVRRRAARTLT